MNLKRKSLAIFIIIIIGCMIATNPVKAWTYAQDKAADINGDGNVDNKDIELMVQQGFPQAPNSGKKKESADGNYIFRNLFSGVGIIGSDGEFTPGEGDIIGYYTRTVNGKLRTFTIYDQTQVGSDTMGDSYDYGKKCNRLAATAIASGYQNDVGLSAAQEASVTGGLDFIGSDTNSTEKYFGKFGLTSQVNPTGRTWDESITNMIVEALREEKFVMFDIDNPMYKGKSQEGTDYHWTTSRHWLALLDIRADNGICEVFVAMVNGNAECGWYTIDEWSDATISNVTIIGEN